MNTLKESNLQLPGIEHRYVGKVRDVYTLDNSMLVMVATDRLSAFDVVMPRGIPFKGQVLNQLASKFLDKTSDIVRNWKIDSPDPNVTVGLACEPFKVEMVIRGYLTGHAWRTYKEGNRILCGVRLPDGLKEHDKLPEPIITPTTKADEGHDEDISREEILYRGIVTEHDYKMLEDFTRKLFQRGSEIAAERGLILVDTKYEFGKRKGEIFLIDEIHTPDSSRYFYADGYLDRQQKGEQQKQLSKEFVRQWLIEHDFMGKDGQSIPEMPDEFIEHVSNRYIELYESLTGEKFVPAESENIEQRIENNVLEFLKKHG
ncbi:phosphoribosylaminoimidazolesuccinocarboxamide synthase [Halocola ammonii]